MELMQYLFDFILRIDVHLGEIIRRYSLRIYTILLVIIFCETGQEIEVAAGEEKLQNCNKAVIHV